MAHDIKGQRFGRLVAIERVGSNRRKEWLWRCACDCGSETIVPSYRLRHGGVTSCGCHQRDCAYRSKKAKNNPRLYGVYRDMKDRCYNKNCEQYKNYGGRGIKICSEWGKFDAFCDWALANGYNPNAKYGQCTIDRIDTNGDYSPVNCRWVNLEQQANNRRVNSLITYANKTMTATQWERERGLWNGAIAYRLSRGWTVDEAIFSLPRKSRKKRIDV